MRLLSLVLALLLSLAPVFAQKDAASDDRIYNQVRLKLAGDMDVRGGNIDVEVHDGAVTLKGKVEKDKQKSKAEKLAKKVKGVKSVDNQLVVGPNRCAAAAIRSYSPSTAKPNLWCRMLRPTRSS